MSTGTYTFRWTQPAEEVFVTGSFDKWSKSQRLYKTADGTHLATVDVPHEKITYKFVVDGKWVTDPAQESEVDHEGNTNNVLYPDDISAKSDEPTFSTQPIPETREDSTVVSPFIQSSGHETTTSQLAAGVPLEPKRDLEAESNAKAEQHAHISSVAPESTIAALAAEVPLEQRIKEEPIVPQSHKVTNAPDDLPSPDEKIPGHLPDTTDDSKDQTFSVNPIPASDGPTNPTTLGDNEPVPPHTASVTDNVKLDEESYNKPDSSNLGVGATASAAFAAVTGAFTTAVSSVTGRASTDQGRPTSDELKDESTSAPTTTAGYLSEKIRNLIPESALPISIPGLTNSASGDHTTSTTDSVPEVVTESQFKADAEPEASGNTTAVALKKEVEDELVGKTKLEEPITTTSAVQRADVPEVVRGSQVLADTPLEASGSPAAVEAKKTIEAELLKEVKVAEPISETPAETDKDVPAIVESSIAKAGTSSEAVHNPAAIHAKEAVEQAITHGESKVHTLDAPTTDGEKPTTGEKVAETAENVKDKTLATLEGKKDTPAEPTTTTTTASGPSASAAEPKSIKPSDAKSIDTAGSASGTTGTPTKDKKKKRMSSFFGKIKQTFK